MMNINPYILLLLGLLLVFVEFFIPGAIMGICGGAMILASIILFAVQSQSLVATVLFAIGSVIGLIVLIKFALWRIRTAKPGYSIYSNADQEGFVASHYDSSAIGKRGVVDTDLKPGGHIIVDGKRLQAISQSGYITKGTEIIVIGGQEESLIVKLCKKDNLS